jgi:hypothetical protein
VEYLAAETRLVKAARTISKNLFHPKMKVDDIKAISGTEYTEGKF